ncbi:MAG TPA: peptidoglycan DD-metalloendopeptidase family protein [Usitatibacteraceae bacterium]|nr:peptidoglycan DD-metalloendopeptidase family protein [Usitatibacteraceae bacterium]
MRARAIAAALLACAGLAVCPASAAPRTGAKPAPPPASEEDLRQLRARIERLEKDLAQAEESRGEAADALKASEKAVSEANRALFELSNANEALSAQLSALGEKSDRARKEIEGQQALAERLLRLQYEQGGQDRLRLILEGRDLAAVARHLAYFGYIQRARAESLVELRRGAEEVAALESQAREKRAAIAENQAAQARESRRLEKERSARAAAHKRLAGRVAQGKREIGRLRRDEERLTRLVQEIARALAAREAQKSREARQSREAGQAREAARAKERDAGKETPERKPGTTVDQVADASLSARAFSSLKGRLRLPVPGDLMNRYGSPREEGGTTWRGLFIRAAVGEVVRAVADGRVVYADWLRGFGNLLILDHGGGYMSLYGYNEGLLRQVGEGVRSGDVVAQVGASGGAEESGLYFELRLDGKPFDPLRWVSR